MLKGSWVKSFKLCPWKPWGEEALLTSSVYSSVILTFMEQNVCTREGVPRPPADRCIATASIWDPLVSGQGSLFCPHVHIVSPSAFPSVVGTVLGLRAEILDCCRLGVFCGWWVCCVSRVYSEGHSSRAIWIPLFCTCWGRSHPPSPLPSSSLLPDTSSPAHPQFYLISGRGETGFNLSPPSDTSNLCSHFMIGGPLG